MAIPYPMVGAWYEQFGGQLFRVVALDEDDGTVEVQHFDGTIQELELEDWAELLLSSAAAPEDWTGSVDIDAEDVDFDDGSGHWSWSGLNPDRLEYPDIFDPN